MNAHTTITPEGNIPIPADVVERLGLTPGMDIVIDEAAATIKLKPGMRLGVKQGIGEIRLKILDAPSPFPRTTTEDILAFPKWEGTPKTVEELRLDDETLRQIFDERDREDSGY
jgi:bifunctional DNA-binding transcriptional regulator/antitoxin component of YhaV-PrlF toxin-antitoxin module